MGIFGQTFIQRLMLQLNIESNVGMNTVIIGEEIIPFLLILSVIPIILLYFSERHTILFRLFRRKGYLFGLEGIRDKSAQTFSRGISCCHYANHNPMRKEGSCYVAFVLFRIFICSLLSSTGYLKLRRFLYFIRAVLCPAPAGCRKSLSGRDKSCIVHATAV